VIRIALGVFVVALIIVTAIALQGQPGVASLTWLGWQVNTTAAAGVLLIGLLALLATLFWSTLVWLLQAPARARRAGAEARRRQAGEVLTKGFVAAAAGDGPEARRLAQKAAELAQETPQLVRILAAQAAEAAGDRAAARAAYGAMLGFADMRLAAHRGLMQTALAQGDAPEALRQARAAYELAGDARMGAAPWAWRAVLEARLEAGDWTEALALVAGAVERKIVSPLTAERARAALQAASAASREAAGDSGEALEFVQAAAKARPDFTPGPVIAARLLAADGRAARAVPTLEAAWKARAHPALWLTWRDLRTDETPVARAQRLAALAQLAPETREARILMVEQALIAGDAAAARTAAGALESEPVTQRIASLMARVAAAGGQTDEARAWIARGTTVPRDPEWADIDPTGRAFAYTPTDWARLVAAYAETGELIHPRFERREPTLNDLPQIPAAYADNSAVFDAAQSGGAFPPIVDDGDFGQDLEPADQDDAQPRDFLALGGRGKAR